MLGLLQIKHRNLNQFINLASITSNVIIISCEICLKSYMPIYIFIDYTMSKVVLSRISARPSCILQRVMGPEGLGRYSTHGPRKNTIREG